MAKLSPEDRIVLKRQEKQNLHDRIHALEVHGGPSDQFEIQQLKREKLALADEITRLERADVPA